VSRGANDRQLTTPLLKKRTNDEKENDYIERNDYRNKQSAEAINVIEKAANLYAANNR
jgi:hypothetical protein